MTLQAPILDDRTMQDIVDECKRMIPRFTPEWTDHNVSDPGVTMIELFAWMVELLLFRMNQVPTRNYIKFLDLIGVHLEPPQPARTEVLFRLTASQPETVIIPAGTEVATHRTETSPAIVFATEAPLEITVPVFATALIARDEFAYRDYTPALRNRNLRVPIFEDPPRPGNSFYLGYEGNLARHILVVHLECEAEGIGVDPKNPPLAWEYYDGSVQDWLPMAVEEDTTGGLNRDGHVIVSIPTASRPRELDRRRASWIRCRITAPKAGQRQYTASPRIVNIHTESLGGAVVASHSQVVQLEILGRSDGTAAQTFTLLRAPVLPCRPGETVEVETEAPGIFEPWQEVTHFAGSAEDDRHFTCDSASGQIAFGPTIRLPNGQERRHGRVPPMGRAIRFSRYRTGGGIVGNVGKETLTELKTSIPYIQWVTNPQPAIGGTEPESLDAALLRGPQMLRSSPRAVTAADFERLALEGSSDLARARCVYARERDDGLAGSVRLVLVPRMRTTDRPVPPEELALSDRLRTTVQDYLDERRMITVRMVLGPPAYLPVAVQVEAHARPRVDHAEVQRSVEGALYRFIHPTVGGPDSTGWPFERPLFVSDIYGLLQRLEKVDHIGTVTLLRVDAALQMQPVDGDALVVPPGTLLCSAPHQVSVL